MRLRIFERVYEGKIRCNLFRCRRLKEDVERFILG